MNKKVLSLLCALLLCFAFALPFAVAADADAEPGETMALFSSDDAISDAVSAYMGAPVTVGDYADLLTEAQELVLKGQFSEIAEKYNVNVAVAAVQSLGGQTVENAAENYCKNEGNLQGDTILLYLAIGTRDFDIFATAGRAESIFFAKGREYIFRQVKSYLSEDDFYDAFHRFGEVCDDFLARDAAGEPYTEKSLPNEKSPICFVIAVGAGLLIGTVIMAKYKGELKTVRKRNEATSYIRQNSMQVQNAGEMFMYSRVSKVKRQTESSSGGAHSSHTSGGGHTSGKF